MNIAEIKILVEADFDVQAVIDDVEGAFDYISITITLTREAENSRKWVYINILDEMGDPAYVAYELGFAVARATETGAQS